MKRHGMHQNRISVLAFALAAALTLAGCGQTFPALPFVRGQGEGKRGEEEFQLETLGLTPEFSYERKEEIPSVRVDRLGYLPGSVKTAVFRGGELPETFQVISKETGESVYEGTIRTEEMSAGAARTDGSLADGLRTGYGTFTELKEEGSYYIQCDLIGCSYYFTIGKDVYLEKAKEFAATIEGSQGETERESEEVCEMLSYLLAAYEMYPDLFEKIWDAGTVGDGKTEKGGGKFFKMLRAHTDLLLTIQDETTGGVYREVGQTAAAEKNAQQEISAKATAVYAGTMAKYSYLYQEYDWDYANICLKAAAKAWHYLDREERRRALDLESVATARIYAAAELYRASNERAYHNYVIQNTALYESALSERGGEDLYLLLGKLTYLSTKRAVESELCGQIMGGLMKGAREIASEGKAETYLVKQAETLAIPWEMTALALTNYAIMNQEYVTVIENYLHYLFGRNEKAALLLEQTDGAGAARMMLLLGIVEAERKIIEDSAEKQAES